MLDYKQQYEVLKGDRFMKANYHTHTVRCNHAVGSEREYIESAITQGMTDLGFSDHMSYIYPDNYQRTYTMKPDDIGEYFKSLSALRTEYSDRIRIHIGFESEYYDYCFKENFERIMQYPVDYLILGQHFIGGHHGHIATSGTDDVGLLKAYTDEVIEALKTQKFSAVAHPDVFKFTGDEDVYSEQVKRLCLAAKENNVPLEINMLGAGGHGNKRRHYPSERFFKIVAQVGNEVIIGCDAHSPDMISNREGYDICRDILRKYNISPLKYLKFKPL